MRPLVALAAVAVVIALVAPDLIPPIKAVAEGVFTTVIWPVIQPAFAAWTR